MGARKKRVIVAIERALRSKGKTAVPEYNMEDFYMNTDKEPRTKKPLRSVCIGGGGVLDSLHMWGQHC